MNRLCGQRTIDYSAEVVDNAFVSIPDAESSKNIFVAFEEVVKAIKGGAIMIASDSIPDEIGSFVNDLYGRGINHIYLLTGTEKVPEILYGKAYLRKIDRKQNGVLIIQRTDDGKLTTWVFSDKTLKYGLKSETGFAQILYQSFCSLFWEQATSESCVDNKWRKPQKSPFQYIPVDDSVCISGESLLSRIHELEDGKSAVAFLDYRNIDFCQDISGKDKQLIVKDRELKDLDAVKEIDTSVYLTGTEIPPFDIVFNRDAGIVFPSEVSSKCVNWILMFEDVPSSKIADVCDKKWQFFKTISVGDTLNHSVRRLTALDSEYYVESQKAVAKDYVCETVEDYLDDDRAFNCYIEDNPVKTYDSVKIDYSITFFPPPLPKSASLHKANGEWKKTLEEWTKSIENIGLRCDKALEKLPNPNNAAAISIKNRCSKLKSSLDELVQSTKRISSFTVAQRENYDQKRLKLDEEARTLNVDCEFERYKDNEMKKRNSEIENLRRSIESMQRNNEQTADKLSKKEGELQSKQAEYDSLSKELEQKRKELEELEKKNSDSRKELDEMEKQNSNSSKDSKKKDSKSEKGTESKEYKEKKSFWESIKNKISSVRSDSNNLKNKGESINKDKTRLENEIKSLESSKKKCEEDIAGLQAKIRDIQNKPEPEKKPTEELAKLLGIKENKLSRMSFPETILPEFETALLYSSNNQNYVAIPSDSTDEDFKSDTLNRDADRLNAILCVRE